MIGYIGFRSSLVARSSMARKPSVSSPSSIETATLPTVYASCAAALRFAVSSSISVGGVMSCALSKSCTMDSSSSESVASTSTPPPTPNGIPVGQNSSSGDRGWTPSGSCSPGIGSAHRSPCVSMTSSSSTYGSVPRGWVRAGCGGHPSGGSASGVGVNVCEVLSAFVSSSSSFGSMSPRYLASIAASRDLSSLSGGMSGSGDGVGASPPSIESGASIESGKCSAPAVNMGSSSGIGGVAIVPFFFAFFASRRDFFVSFLARFSSFLARFSSFRRSFSVSSGSGDGVLSSTSVSSSSSSLSSTSSSSLDSSGLPTESASF